MFGIRTNTFIRLVDKLVSEHHSSIVLTNYIYLKYENVNEMKRKRKIFGRRSKKIYEYARALYNKQYQLAFVLSPQPPLLLFSFCCSLCVF